MEISLENYKLVKLREDNAWGLKFIRDLFSDEEVNFYLGHLENDRNNVYIVCDNDGNYIGYLSMSDVVLNMKNLTSVTLYYAIDKKYRGMGYGTGLLKEVSAHLLKEVDMLVMMIDVRNEICCKAAKNASFKEEIISDEDIIYTKYSGVKVRQK